MPKLKPFFDPVGKNVDFPAMEEKLLKEWQNKGLIKKYLKKNDASQVYFSFLDGPITANNPMGVHHAWGRTYKDLWQRYKNMRGFRQRFQNGFDCQGLWVEVEVEKELGLKTKKDIEKLGIAEFVDFCKKRVIKYSKIQTEQSKRLGYFMDWDHSYYTMSDENNYMIWHFLKKCYQEGLIYKGRDSVPWCPRCGTAISQHEMLTEDYKELTHEALYVSYPLKNRRNENLLIWTTTPWTLPANVACAVDPKIDYCLAQTKDGKDKFYLLPQKARSLGLTVIKKIKGEELIGVNYISVFDKLPQVKKSLGNYVHRVIRSDERILPISQEEGTGIVHVATGAGAEDFALGKKEGLPVIEVIDEMANYLAGFGSFSGKNAKNDPQLIISFLESRGFLFKKEKYKHRYPACWRCKTELVWRVVDEWYIAIDPVREKMKKVAKGIKWIPKFGLKRELDWLSNMHDWLISKKRYWGLALPIWECSKCKHFEVIGSKEELCDRAVAGWNKFQGHSPHRPWIDEVKIKCAKCGQLAERIADVGNPWLDAGIVSFSTISQDNQDVPLYLTKRQAWKKWFPADFITESFSDQFKNWFYSLIAMSTVLENSKPFKRVLGFATLLAEDGQPMHKSWGNAIEFNEGANKIGVDVMRWMYIRQNPKENLLFGYKVADNVRRTFHLKFWNVYNFFITYANADRWHPSKNKITTENILDKWLLLKLVQLETNLSSSLDNFDAYQSSVLIEKFVEDLSNWYIRRSRERVGPGVDQSKDKESFYQTCYFVLVNLSCFLAPFIPFLSEIIYQNLTRKESVHLVDWPGIDLPFKADSGLFNKMELAREIVEKGHAERKRLKIPVRQPLQSIKVGSLGEKLPNDILKLIEEELNIKETVWTKAKTLVVTLNTKMTPQLEQEAKIRELIRKVQKERMKMGIDLTQRINLTNPWLPTSKDLIQKLKQKTLVSNLEKGRFRVVKSS